MKRQVVYNRYLLFQSFFSITNAELTGEQSATPASRVIDVPGDCSRKNQHYPTHDRRHQAPETETVDQNSSMPVGKRRNIVPLVEP